MLDTALAKHRGLLYGECEKISAEQNVATGRRGMTRERVQEVIQTKGKLSRCAP